MNFYRITHEDATLRTYPATYADKQSTAHEAARALPAAFLASARIELIDVDTSKDGVLALLNDQYVERPALRTWKLTSRGGMVDCSNGE